MIGMFQPLHYVADVVDMRDRRPHTAPRGDKSAVRSDEPEIDQARSWIGKTPGTRFPPPLLIDAISGPIDCEVDLPRCCAIDRDARLQLEKSIGDQSRHAGPRQDHAIGQPAKTGANLVILDRMVQKVRIE